MDDLLHYGIPGQKKGVRRGPPYPLTRVTKGNAKSSNEIYKTLTKKEKNYVLGNNSYDKPSNRLIKKTDIPYIVKQTLVKFGDTPISAVDLWRQDKDKLAVSVVTRNEKQYRGKGYASKALKKAIDGVLNSKEFKEYRYVDWGVWKTNIASRKMARKFGFKYVKTSDPGGEDYMLYRKKIR